MVFESETIAAALVLRSLSPSSREVWYQQEKEALRQQQREVEGLTAEMSEKH